MGRLRRVIVGRDPELSRIRDLVESARGGQGGALVIAGEAGIGKSALIQEALAGFTDQRWLQGAEAERDLPYAALGTLCLPYVDRFGVLSEAHRTALEIALGLRQGDAPSRMVVGLALLDVLADAAEREPIVVAVDDFQWLDQQSRDALLVVARRLFAESLAMVFTIRTDQDQSAAFGGLPSMELTGLSVDAAATLLPQAHHSVAATLADLTAGNPLAMIEAGHGLSEDELSGSRPIVGIAATRPEQIFAQRLADLPESARRAARLIAFAGDAPREVLTVALGIGGLSLDDLVPAEGTGLIRVERTASWRHPLARSAAGRGTAAELAEAHRTLAVAWADVAPDNPARAWHLADSVIGTDPIACDALVAAGELAAHRGASSDAADAFERAARLSADADRRVGLLELAGVHATRAGLAERASGLLDEALGSGPSGEAEAKLSLTRGRLEYLIGNPASAFDLLARAIEVSRDHSLRVWAAAEAHLAGFFMGDDELTQRAADQVVAHHDRSDPIQSYLALWAEAGAAGAREDYETCRETTDRAWDLMVSQRLLEREPALVFHAVEGEMVSGRLQPLRPEERTAIDRLRRSGDLTWLPRTLILAAEREQNGGRLRGVYEAYEEAELLSRLSGHAANLAEALLALAEWDAYRADARSCLARCREAQELIERHGLRRLDGWAASAEALLSFSTGEPDRAVPILQAHLYDQAWIPVDLAYALYLRGEPVGEDDLDTPDGTVADWARDYIGALADTDDRRAAERLLNAEVWDQPLDRARYRLAAGQRLRRAGERRAARQVLGEALEVFEAAQATPWIDRTAGELEATGAHLRSRQDAVALTPSESRVARLVAEGRTNKDVAALLFLSPKTVEFHLAGVYRKLGISNRTALSRKLAEQDEGES